MSKKDEVTPEVVTDDKVGEVLVVEETTTAVAAPIDRKGFENVDVESITMPRVKLLQSNSPELAEEDYDFRAGDRIHSFTMEKLPEKFVPIMFLPDSNILFLPRNDADKAKVKARFNLSDDDLASGMVICRARDGKHGDRFGSCAQCGACKFNGNEKPLCTSSINVLVLPEGEDMPVVLQFSNTSKKHGTKFKNTTFFSKGNLYDNVYKLTGLRRTDNGNSWYEMSVKPAGKSDDETREKAEAMYAQFKAMIIDVEEEDTSFSAPASEPTEY